MSALFIWAHSSAEYVQSDEQLSQKQKQAGLLVLETGKLKRRVAYDGGYPAEAAIVGDYVVFSDCDHDGAPELEVYTVDEWIIEAEKILAELSEWECGEDD